MIRHIVLVRFRPEVSDAAIAKIFADLDAIRSVVPGVLAIASGRSESPEKIERGYMHGFTVDFAGGEALAAYQAHPDHRAVGEALVASAQGGLDGILVFDLPMSGTA
ncbi:MAG: Dabb family protein [Alphaproteobacteria bacterium]|nr:Dabb family protein [Alphaproteobacteria bacterium]MBU0802431.1 Dabb family protein [Alphaproteobacteria bacterium]MBU0870127.1 Dabb family protein [Alphaproteobacteria bacterium]MBU1399930.1 Dabb family protein [Alphaproteobacteria bacterium]MBU1590316.1 Dabb family protein [Alphaproteobacteria bacterium]